MKKSLSAIKQQGVSTAEAFTYVLIVIVCASTAYGMYFNYTLENVIAEALEAGESQKAQIEAYFEAEGHMPQNEAEAGLEDFIPTGVLKKLSWHAGALGEPGSDSEREGTLNGLVDLSDYGARFEKVESAFLLVARAQEDGTIAWDCLADTVTVDALTGNYLPESCRRASDSEE